MAWQDRHYYRERGSGAGNPLMWLLTGSVPLFTIFGIRVRAHASLVVLIALVLLFGLGQGTGVQDRVTSMTILFGIILLHEFGHCFAARWTGGSAEEIMMTPLGGLAMTMARRRAWPTFATVAGGPLVNVAICVVAALALLLLGVRVPLNPWGFWSGRPDAEWLNVAFHIYWVYFLSYILLLFNMLPIFPLDGGQLLQAILWPKMGYYRSMMLALNIGLVGSVMMCAFGLATLSNGGLLIALIAIFCFLNSYQFRALMKAEGPWGFSEEDSMDYTSSLYATADAQPSRSSRRAEKRAARLAQEEKTERARIDRILEKVSQHGMQSLSWWEKRTLRKATEHQRQRDMAMGRTRRM
jgi:Zn-dependent protease